MMFGLVSYLMLLHVVLNNAKDLRSVFSFLRILSMFKSEPTVDRDATVGIQADKKKLAELLSERKKNRHKGTHFLLFMHVCIMSFSLKNNVLKTHKTKVPDR